MTEETTKKWTAYKSKDSNGFYYVGDDNIVCYGPNAKENAELIVNAVNAFNGTTKDNLVALTKREYFAGLAMQGILANENFKFNEDFAAKEAVSQAGRLLYELEKPQPQCST